MRTVLVLVVAFLCLGVGYAVGTGGGYAVGSRDGCAQGGHAVCLRLTNDEQQQLSTAMASALKSNPSLSQTTGLIAAIAARMHADA